jgi:hypothetical protein
MLGREGGTAMQVSPRCALSDSEENEIHRSVQPLVMLGDVVRWNAASIVDVIVQDEFTHDVVVSRGPRWLVFDTT